MVAPFADWLYQG